MVIPSDWLEKNGTKVFHPGHGSQKVHGGKGGGGGGDSGDSKSSGRSGGATGSDGPIEALPPYKNGGTYDLAPRIKAERSAKNESTRQQIVKERAVGEMQSKYVHGAPWGNKEKLKTELKTKLDDLESKRSKSSNWESFYDSNAKIKDTHGTLLTTDGKPKNYDRWAGLLS